MCWLLEKPVEKKKEKRSYKTGTTTQGTMEARCLSTSVVTACSELLVAKEISGTRHCWRMTILFGAGLDTSGEGCPGAWLGER